jgi:hypothetical protein
MRSLSLSHFVLRNLRISRRRISSRSIRRDNLLVRAFSRRNRLGERSCFSSFSSILLDLDIFLEFLLSIRFPILNNLSQLQVSFLIIDLPKNLDFTLINRFWPVICQGAIFVHLLDIDHRPRIQFFRAREHGVGIQRG